MRSLSRNHEDACDINPCTCGYAPLRSRIGQLEQEVERLTKSRDECIAVFEIDRKHALIGPVDACSCPSCEVFLKEQYALKQIEQKLQIAVEALEHFTGRYGFEHVRESYNAELAEETLAAIRAGGGE